MNKRDFCLSAFDSKNEAKPDWSGCLQSQIRHLTLEFRNPISVPA